MIRYETEFIGVKKESLEVLILNYIFSNLERGENRFRYAGEAFSKINKDSMGNLTLTVEYKVFTEYTFEDGERDNFEDIVQITLKGSHEYSRKDMELIKEEMYLGSVNDVAFIHHLLKSANF